MTKAIPAESLKKTIAYFYLLSYCPPEQIADFKRSTAPMRVALAENAGMKEAAYFTQVLPEVCRRIVAFHQATREPDPKMVEALAGAARTADENPDTLTAFQAEMAHVAASPGRAKPENRLHRNKGCRYCAAACRYGYFTLVSDPQFSELQGLFTAEVKKPASQQSPLGIAYGFTLRHIHQLTGAPQDTIRMEDMIHLSYCLLLLGMAKSRLPLPENSLRMLQAANQEFIRRQAG